MADEDGEINWYMPGIRAVIPLNHYNIPRSLRKFMKDSSYTYKFDNDIMNVIRKCAEREYTWISDRLIEAYRGLHEKKHLHSVEVYQKNVLVGGLYGVAVKGAFFGESMFSRAQNASKCALVKLLERMKEKNFKLLDVQFLTEHLQMFGAVEIPFEDFEKLLIKSYAEDVYF